jgi:hypothetical protein
MTAITTTPAQIDTRIAELSREAERAAFAIEQAVNSYHRTAIDTRGRDGNWVMTNEQARAAVRSDQLGPLLRDEMRARIEHARLLGQIQALEAIYLASPWSRYYPCRNTNGHIHTSERGCSTVSYSTNMGWFPELSGLTPAEVVEQVGPALCSVCYPEAPVEHTSSNLTAIERAARRPELDARKAEIAEKRARTQLDPAYDEPFKASHYNERIETVNACQRVIRNAIDQEVEVEFFSGRTAAQSGWDDEARYAQFLANIRRSLDEQRADAGRATRILIAREERHEGYGMTIDALITMKERKLKASRKAWAKNAD